MKKAITFWVEDDVDVVALCGTLMLKRVENVGKDYGADGAQMFNLSPNGLKPEYFCPIKGNMNDEMRAWVDGDLPRKYCPNCGAKMEVDG